MNKKVALVILVRNSILLPDEAKLSLLNQVSSLNDRQVEALGKFLATEREIALESEQEIHGHVDTFLHELEEYEQTKQQGNLQGNQPDQVEQIYIGSGRP